MEHYKRCSLRLKLWLIRSEPSPKGRAMSNNRINRSARSGFLMVTSVPLARPVMRALGASMTHNRRRETSLGENDEPKFHNRYGVSITSAHI
jgi:hypothetical protein